MFLKNELQKAQSGLLFSHVLRILKGKGPLPPCPPLLPDLLHTIVVSKQVFTLNLSRISRVVSLILSDI